MLAMELKLTTCASAIAIGVGVAPLTGRSRPRRRPAGAALRAPKGPAKDPATVGPGVGPDFHDNGPGGST
jgi:hypothetical protein